jgi:hypothetical protein
MLLFCPKRDGRKGKGEGGREGGGGKMKMNEKKAGRADMKQTVGEGGGDRNGNSEEAVRERILIGVGNGRYFARAVTVQMLQVL